MQLTLDHTQAEVLRETLDSTLRDLRFEIADTDNPAFRRQLKAREEVLRSLLTALGSS
jgi:hypothetical protein